MTKNGTILPLCSATSNGCPIKPRHLIRFYSNAISVYFKISNISSVSGNISNDGYRGSKAPPMLGLAPDGRWEH